MAAVRGIDLIEEWANAAEADYRSRRKVVDGQLLTVAPVEDLRFIKLAYFLIGLGTWVTLAVAAAGSYVNFCELQLIKAHLGIN